MVYYSINNLAISIFSKLHKRLKLMKYVICIDLCNFTFKKKTCEIHNEIETSNSKQTGY